MESLVTKDILTYVDMEKIDSKRTNREKARALLTLMAKGQDSGFSALIEALKESGSPDLAGILEREGRQYLDV